MQFEVGKERENIETDKKNTHEKPRDNNLIRNENVRSLIVSLQKINERWIKCRDLFAASSKLIK